mmetsp:Transcript_10373/g.11488  ORF Transcript_10373/g.11488 Transcript_10373/m.11488 type:complete len:1125 (-) Transcript_10373:173-3547(-)
MTRIMMIPNTQAVAVVPFLAVLSLLLSLTGVSGQGCTNRCPPVNFGVVVPALCEGDRIDDTTSDSNGVAADITRVYDVCYPNTDANGDSLSFKFDDLRGPSNTVTVIANYYTGCNAGRRESGVFAHVAQKYYDRYGPDKVHFIQSVKGGGTCDQWSAIYQRDAAELFPDSSVQVKEMPWSVDDTSYKIRDELFTSPFGHPAYVILDGNLEIKHKFIGPCCGYESYYDCTPDIARTLDTTLSGYLDTILLSAAEETDVDVEDDIGDNLMATTPSDLLPEGWSETVWGEQVYYYNALTGASTWDRPTITTPVAGEDEDTLDCNWSEWSPCSIRCGPTPGTQIRFVDRRCNTQQGFDFPTFESRECAADNAFNCNVEDGGSVCIPEFGEDYEIKEVHGDFHSPRDVKFHPTPGYHLGSETDGRKFVVPEGGDEAWIVNGNNHSISIINAVGNSDYQSSINRQDRGYYHYLINGTAISFNSVQDSGRTVDRDTYNYWSICNDNNNNYLSTKEANYFMGPTLYDSSPLNKNLVNKLGEECNPVRGEECFFLHSDMLHESPSCRGIVHDPELETSYGTVYWVFDSTGNRNVGQLVRYDFQQPHGPGSMDHSIASVRRFIEVELETSDEALEQAGVHAGMVVHPTTRELYIAVPGKNQILKVDADSGQFARTAREEYPIYSNRLPSFEYSIWECVDQSIFAANINQPSGMTFSLDYERLFVAERGTGSILVYEVETGEWLATIRTQFRTMGGLAISPNGGELYFVDADTNTLQSISIISECDQVYAPRMNPEYKRVLEQAKIVLGVPNPFTLLPQATTCTVDPIVPNITFFDQVHVDTGYASDNPDVQSVHAGMDAAAALLANRTDCEVDSDLNFDALLLGGYYCHPCLPDQQFLCGGGTTREGDKSTVVPGSCTNVQWEGYICDNEFQIVENTNTALPGTYRIQTMNGTDVDSSTLVLKRGVTYRFEMQVEDEVCLTTARSVVSSSLIDSSREDVKFGQSLGRDESSRDSLRDSRDRSSLSSNKNNRESALLIPESVTLGCATRVGGPLIFNVGSREMTGPQIYVNIGVGAIEPVFAVGMEAVPASLMMDDEADETNENRVSSSSRSVGVSRGAFTGIVMAATVMVSWVM